MKTLSIIVPALNEEKTIHQTLQPLMTYRQRGHEIILVDGSSKDHTVEYASPYVDTIITSAAGRARQMNKGASIARGDILLFLHADTLLPDKADKIILQGLGNSGAVWGRFDVHLDGHAWLFRVVEKMMNWRSRLSGIATGDQAMFISRSAFHQLGGFPEIAIMEDIAISKGLKTLSRPLCLPTAVITSSRRWQNKGIIRTILLMWRLRLAYFFGSDPAHIAQLYNKH